MKGSVYGSLLMSTRYFPFAYATMLYARVSAALLITYDLNVIRELRHATFLNHGPKPEVNISYARTLSGLSQIFKLIVSSSEKRHNNINV